MPAGDAAIQQISTAQHQGHGTWLPRLSWLAAAPYQPVPHMPVVQLCCVSAEEALATLCLLNTVSAVNLLC
jgi:hypothetical protein